MNKENTHFVSVARILGLLLCLLLSITVWLVSLDWDMPVEKRVYNDISLTVSDGVTVDKNTVSATFSGTKTDLYGYKKNGIVAFADTAGLSAGEHTVTLSFYSGDKQITPDSPVTVHVVVKE